MVRLSQLRALILNAFLCMFLVAAVQAQVPTISTYAGGGLPTAGPATGTGLSLLGGIARDPAGNLYFSSFTGVILKMDLAGNFSVFAGTGPCCFSGDGGLATSAQLSIMPYIPTSPVKTDPAGNVYLVDNAGVIRRIDHVTGIITTVAGTPDSTGFSGAGGPATSAQMSPAGLAFDVAGNLFVSDFNYVVWRVDHVTQTITIVAGNGTPGFSGDGGPATSAQLSGPTALAVDAAGDLFIADGDLIRRVDAVTQDITTVAGGGLMYPPTGILATQAALNNPTGLAFDPGGNLLIADPGLPAVLRVDETTQNITVIAGSFTQGAGFSGDGGVATSAQLGQSGAGSQGMDLAVDSAGTIFVTDTVNYRVRRIDAVTNIITTVAGNGTVGDGGQATSAVLFTIGIAQDGGGNIYISDPVNRRVRRVDSTSGLISTVAGRDVESTPPSVNSGNGGPAIAAQLSQPGGLALDGAGNIFFLDNASVVRRVDRSTGTISLFAGSTGVGSQGFSGDGGPATSAKLEIARGLATDAVGNLFIADTLNNVVRRVDASTLIINTVVGNASILTNGRPTAGYSGDGGLATSAQLSAPWGLFVDSAGNLFIADSANGVVRRVDAKTQIITTVAGNNSLAGGFSGDTGQALAAALNEPVGVTMDAFGNLYITDRGNYRVRLVNAVTGIITTLAGNGNLTFAGDGGPAANASLWAYQTGLTTLGPGSGGDIEVLVMDGTSGRVRVITIPPVPAAFLTPAVGLTFGSQVVGMPSAPQFVTIANSGTGTLNVANVGLTGTDTTDFTMSSGGTCPGTNFSLAPTTSCTIAITFVPFAAGTRLAGVTFTDNAAPGIHSVPLSGASTGAGGPTVLLTPVGPLTFAPVALGTAAGPQAVNVQNAGNAVMSFSNITVTGNGFSLGPATTCPTGAGLLAVGANCTLSVIYTPQVAGTGAGQVTITDNAAFGPQVIALTGMGTTTQTITQPLSPTAPNQFNFGPHNFTVQYPAGTSFTGVNMTVAAVQTPVASFQQRVAGTSFANAVCIVYEGEGGYCEDYQVTCTDMSGNAISCPNESTPTIDVKTSYDTTQSIVNPGFLTAPIGTNNWTNIFTAFFLQRIDPTTKGHTTGFSEFFAVDLGASNPQGAAQLTTLAPLQQNDARIFPVGTLIPVAFQLTSTARPGQPVTDSVAGITVMLMSGTNGSSTPSIILEKSSAFRYEDGKYVYNLNTRGYAPGTYNLTVYGNAFAAYQVQFTLPVSTSGARLQTQIQALTFDASARQYLATLTVTNTGREEANGVIVFASGLDFAATSTIMPISLGDIGPNSSVTLTLGYPASAGRFGDRALLIVLEAYAGGYGDGLFLVKLP
jgi:sugar lactone lactonase YvrE